MPFKVLLLACKVLNVLDLYYCFLSMHLSSAEIIWSCWCKMETVHFNPCPPCSHTPCTHESLNRWQPTKISPWKGCNLQLIFLLWSLECGCVECQSKFQNVTIFLGQEKVTWKSGWESGVLLLLQYCHQNQPVSSKKEQNFIRYESMCWNPKYSCYN